jgi:hypothetical protein
MVANIGEKDSIETINGGMCYSILLQTFKPQNRINFYGRLK